MAQRELLDILLSLGAIHLAAETPYQWASGWLSPIYCDNRKALSSHEARETICNGMVRIVRSEYPETSCIVGVATGGIPIGAIVAHILQLPFAYVRPKPKDHGLGNQIEGNVPKGAKVVIIEDLISTGGSSLSAAETLRQAEVNVLGMIAIFSYDFPQAKANFEMHNMRLHTLETYPRLLARLCEQGQLNETQLAKLEAWRENPEKWGR